MDKAELAIQGAAAAQITADEVRRLILVASSAHQVQAGLGLADQDFDTWRKGILWEAVHKASFRTLGQRDYGRALDAFIKLGGSIVRTAAGSRPSGKWGATNAKIAARETSPEGDRRRAEFKLREACRETADAYGSEDQARAFARALMLKIHKTTVERATAKQIWAVFFTLRNRAAAKLRKSAPPSSALSSYSAVSPTSPTPALTN